MIRFKSQPKTQFFKFNQQDIKVLKEKKVLCPKCQLAFIFKAQAKWVGRCKRCHNIHNFFYPLPIQDLISILNHRIIFNVGGVGSGKTSGSSVIISSSMRTIPGVPVYAFAQTKQQLNKTGKEELLQFFLQSEFKTFNDEEWVLFNGSSVTWYTSDDAQKLKGVNAGIIWLIEASSIPHAIFKEGLSRNRNDIMKEYAYDEEGEHIIEYNPRTKRNEFKIKVDRVQTIVESNPRMGWIRNHLLLKSKVVIYTPSVRGIKALKDMCKPQKDPESDQILDIVTVMLSTIDNPLMTEDYMSTLRARATSVEEYEQDVYCDMSMKLGLVFGQEFRDGLFVPTDEENHEWSVDGINTQWIESIDPGGAKEGNDETCYGLWTIEQRGFSKLPLIIMRDGFKKSGLDYAQVADKIWKIRKAWGWSLNKADFFVGDPSIKKTTWKSETYKGDMEDLEIYIDPEVSNNILWGIGRVKMLLRNKSFKIPKRLDFMYDELMKYIWEPNRENFQGVNKRLQKPIDKDNHGMDMMRYLAAKIFISPSQSRSMMGDDKYMKAPHHSTSRKINSAITDQDKGVDYYRRTIDYNGSPASLRNKRMNRIIRTF